MSDPRDLWDGLWARLEDGVASADAPARTLALASARTGGCVAARMVILRGSDRAAPNMTIFTNAGSEKVTELRDEPRAEILLWDAGTSFQARLPVTVDMAAGSRELWEALSPGQQLNYVPTPPPGSAIEAPHVPDASGPEAFLVLTARILSADILDLSDLPHKRAQFHARDDFTGRWVAP